MATIIRLDAPAVRRLIEDNPEAKMELTRAVIAEIVRGMFKNDLGKALEMIEPAVYAELTKAGDEASHIRLAMTETLNKVIDGGTWHNPKFKPSDATKAKITEAIKNVEAEFIRDAVSHLSPLIRKAVEERAAEVETAVDRRVANIQEQMILAEVDRRVKAKMNSIYENLKIS